jgi:hypothetical protein
MKYRAVCSLCYTCDLTQPVSKRWAERIATGHMAAYGHNTAVVAADKEARRPSPLPMNDAGR